MNSSSDASARPLTGASASCARPKPPVPASSTRQLARPSVADVSAPPSAPRPKKAVSTPNTSGPPPSVCLAITGSSTLKLKEKVLTTVTIISAISTSGAPRT